MDIGGLLRVLGALKWYDYAVVLAGLWVVLMLGGRDAPPVVVFDARAEIVYQGDRKMRDEAREVFETQFARGSYFGAFYVSPDGAYGWTLEHNSRRAARFNAEAHCRQDGAGCRLVAEILPRGLEDRGGVTLRENAGSAYREYLAGQGARALAISENGTWGWSHQHVTIWAAKSAALRECERLRLEGQADYLPDWPCTVIAARWR